MVESAWPVHELWAAADPETNFPECGHDARAIDDDDAPADDGAGEDGGADRVAEAWMREPTVVRVWREGYSVSHAAMGPDEQRAFRVLARGEPFAEVCAAIEDGLDGDTAARQVGAILLRWLEDGLIARPQP